jgi:hypothetical protein
MNFLFWLTYSLNHWNYQTVRSFIILNLIIIQNNFNKIKNNLNKNSCNSYYYWSMSIAHVLANKS